MFLIFLSQQISVAKRYHAVCSAYEQLNSILELFVDSFSISIMFSVIANFMQLNTVSYGLYLFLVKEQMWSVHDGATFIVLLFWLYINGMGLFLICNEADFLKKQVFFNFLIFSFFVIYSLFSINLYFIIYIFFTRQIKQRFLLIRG